MRNICQVHDFISLGNVEHTSMSEPNNLSQVRELQEKRKLVGGPLCFSAKLLVYTGFLK